MDVPAARQLARPAWVNARTVLGLSLMLVAFIGGQRILADARTTTGYWTAVRDLPRGSEVGPDDVTIAQVQLPGDLAAGYVPSSEVLSGARLNQPVAAGELIPAAVLSRDPNVPGREITIPVPPEHAVGGSLRIGDVVDVYATFAAEGAEARTTLIARGIEVIGLVETGGLVMEEQAKVGVTVGVSPEEATRLAFAIRTADVDVVRVVGGDDHAPAQAVEEGDL